MFDQVARGVAAARRLEPGRVVHAPDTLTADHLAIDLALQGAGLVVMPGSAAAPPDELATPRATLANGGEGSPGDVISIPDVRSRLERWEPVEVLLDRAHAGSVLLAGDPGVRLGPVAQLDAARSFGASVGAIGAARPIVTATGTLGQAGVRTVLDWALSTGAALALDERASTFPDAVVWTRPHVAAGPAALLDEALPGVEEQGKRWRRLRVVAATDGRASSAPAVWEQLGIRWLTLSVADA